MIITVTVNPAMDRTLEIANLFGGGLNIVNASQLDAGGKGINVSKTIRRLGGKAVATGLLGGETGVQIRRRLDHMDIPHDFVDVAGETRTNIKVFDAASQKTTEFNELGPALTLDDLSRLMVKLETLIIPGSIVVLSGSVPKTLPNDTYARLITCVHVCKGMVFLDASGQVFKEAVAAQPDMIKPNRHELEGYFGKAMQTEADYIEAGQHFLSLGIKQIVFSLGNEGAYYINEKAIFRLKPLKVETQSSVGAGDAFVGAFVYGMTNGDSTEDILRLALATSAGAVTTKGTQPAAWAWINSHLKDVCIDRLR
ncbi:MAG: 1-phosphofructokinase [Clostridiales bacterium]|jgi:1-phosphofructokinase|nr:1-phosphofructokinase [Clostridiales bacterium]